jgi:DNA-binding NtrC family response regulator
MPHRIIIVDDEQDLHDFTFTPINMDSLTDQLFNAEFFGYTRGAFTGAEKDRVGY